jgi:hypothetical protein
MPLKDETLKAMKEAAEKALHAGCSTVPNAVKWEAATEFLTFTEHVSALIADYERQFTRGYVCAAAEIMRTHGNKQIARDVLRSAGKVDWNDINEADREALGDLAHSKGK